MLDEYVVHSDAVVRAYEDLSNHDVYMSGPPVMVEAGHTLFMQHRLDESRFFSDAFEYAKDSKQPAPAG